MHLYKLIIILSGIVVCSHQAAEAQRLDSLLSDRQTKLQDYTQFKNGMKERTWINLIELNKLAGEVIKADNDLIWYHLDREAGRNKELLTENEKLRLEMAFLDKEAEMRKAQIDEHRYLNNLFMIIILGISAALIISLGFLIGQFRRNRHAVYELERLWSMNDDQSASLREKENELNKQIRLLEVENEAIQQELSLLSDQKSVARKKLEDEIKSRKKAEDEIRDLINQVKKK